MGLVDRTTTGAAIRGVMRSTSQKFRATGRLGMGWARLLNLHSIGLLRSANAFGHIAPPFAG